jgi:hypothetical protein
MNVTGEYRTGRALVRGDEKIVESMDQFACLQLGHS